MVPDFLKVRNHCFIPHSVCLPDNTLSCSLPRRVSSRAGIKVQQWRVETQRHGDKIECYLIENGIILCAFAVE